MKLLIPLLAVILLSFSTYSQTWMNGVDVEGSSFGTSILPLSNGYQLHTGNAESWNIPQKTGLLAKSNSLGQVVYMNGYIEPGFDTYFKQSAQLNNGKIITVGYQVDSATSTHSRGWILTTTPGGQIMHSEIIGDTISNRCELYGVTACQDGGFCVTGWYENALFDNDVYVARFDNNGTLVWDFIAESTDGSDAGYDIIETSAGMLVVTGYENHFNGEMNDPDFLQLFISGDGTIQNKITAGEGYGYDNGFGAVELDNGNIAAVGTTSSFGSTTSDILLKINTPAGTSVLTKKFSSSDENTGYGILNINGEIVITGEAFNTLQNYNSYGYIMTCDYLGNVSRSKAWSNGNQHYLRRANHDGTHLLVTGFGEGYSEAGIMLNLKLDLNNLSCNFFDTTYNDITLGNVDSIHSLPLTSTNALKSTSSPILHNYTGFTNSSCFYNPNQPCLEANFPFTENGDDISGNGHYASGGAMLSIDRNGVSNNAYKFDGAVEMSSWSFPTSYSGYSLMGWVKTDSINAKQGLIFMEGTQFSTTKSVTGIYIENGQIVGQHQDASEGFQLLSGGSIDTNWTHICLTYDQSFLSIYQDGGFLSSISIADMANVQDLITLGGMYDYGAQGFESGLFGSLDEVKIYKCSLDAAAIDSIYQSEKPMPPCNLAVETNTQPVSCYNGNDGSIGIMITGSNGPYTTLWNNGFSGDILTNLSSGTYSATVTDSVGCSTSVVAEVFNQQITEFQILGTNATCGQKNGSASINVMVPVTPPYSFDWSNGFSENNVTGSIVDSLWSGPWNVTITDGNGCIFNESVYIGEDGGANVTENVSNVTCHGGMNGSIDLTVVGATGSYTVEWTSGGTTEDLSGIRAGEYTFIVKDETGCSTSGSILVTEPEAISITDTLVTTATCGISDGSIQVSAIGGTGALTYNWGANAGNQTGQTASNIPAGTYLVNITDASGCKETGIFDLNNTNGPSVFVQSILAPKCNESLGAINIVTMGGTAPYQYEWNTGATTQNVNNLNPGLYYVLATDEGGCSGAKHITVNGILPKTQEICIVTVDTITGTNLIAWEKPLQANGVDHYVIYRESNAAGVYDSIGTVEYDSLSQFTDPIANPLMRAWRYKVSAVDSCGVESKLSGEHKTLHLTVNLGANGTMNLMWDEYIGFSYASYYIARYHPSTGWINIDTIPSTLTSYTDLNPPGAGSQLLYSVEAPHPSGCTSEKAQGHNSTRSNRANLAGPAPDVSIDEINSGNISLFPNPTTGKFNIVVDHLTSEVIINVTDLHGKMIRQFSTKNQLIEIDLSDVESGVYFVHLSNDQFVQELKVVKQ